MADNILYIPNLVPDSFVEKSPTELPQYLSKVLGDYRYWETIQPWDSHIPYFKKRQKSDTDWFQFESNFDPIGVNLLNCDGEVVIGLNLVNKRSNPYLPGYFVYEAGISYATVPEGYYVLQVEPATPGTSTLIGEPIHVKEKHEGTLLFEYRNSRFHEDVLFETGITFSFRVEGSLGKLLPGSKDQLYEDQKLNQTVLSSKPYNTWPLVIGGTYGVPDWVVEKLNYIFSCDEVRIDGKYYAKESDAKLEFNEEEQYPMRGVKITLREEIKRSSRAFSPTLDTNKRLIVVHNINSQAFGDLSNNAGNNIVVITDLE